MDRTLPLDGGLVSEAGHRAGKLGTCKLRLLRDDPAQVGGWYNAQRRPRGSPCQRVRRGSDGPVGSSVAAIRTSAAERLRGLDPL